MAYFQLHPDYVSDFVWNPGLNPKMITKVTPAANPATSMGSSFYPAVKMLQRKFKVLISFYQIATAISTCYRVEFDLDFQYVLNYFSIMNLDITAILPVTCMGARDYYSRYTIKVMVPTILTLVFYTVHAYKLLPERKLRMFFKCYLYYLFAIYPSMCRAGGESLRCLTTSDEGAPRRRWLMADYKIDCDSNELESFRGFEMLIKILYQLGIPIFFFALLYQYSEVLAMDRYDRSRLPDQISHLEALCVQYEPAYWWFEVVECFRKYLLVAACPIFLRNYPSSAILVAVVVCTVNIVIFQELAAYEFDLDDVLAYISNCTLLFIFLLASYARFKASIASFDVAWTTEVLHWGFLVFLAEFLVVSVLVFAVLCAMWEAYIMNLERIEAIEKAAKQKKLDDWKAEQKSARKNVKWNEEENPKGIMRQNNDEVIVVYTGKDMGRTEVAQLEEKIDLFEPEVERRRDKPVLLPKSTPYPGKARANSRQNSDDQLEAPRQAGWKLYERAVSPTGTRIGDILAIHDDNTVDVMWGDDTLEKSVRTDTLRRAEQGATSASTSQKQDEPQSGPPKKVKRGVSLFDEYVPRNERGDAVKNNHKVDVGRQSTTLAD